MTDATDYSGFVFSFDEPQRAESVRSLASKALVFTDTFSVRDWPNDEREIFLLSLEVGKMWGAALVTKQRQIATEKRVVRFEQFVSFTPSVSFAELHDSYGLIVKDHLANASTGHGRRMDPPTWNTLISALKSLRPYTATELDDLLQLRILPVIDIDQPGFVTMAEEKDAVNLILRLAGFDPIILTKAPLPQEKPLHYLEYAQPILQPTLNGQQHQLLEDQMINHDANVFGDWIRVRAEQAGPIRFIRNGQLLTTMNVNRHSVERTLGVDLLYYHHLYRSYVFVQYKRMDKGKRTPWHYRPDEQCHKQLHKMQAERERLRTVDQSLGTLADYRLRSEMFYFKLCRSITDEPYSTNMIDGIYLPLDYWEVMLENMKDRQDKVIFNEGNIGRNFNNTLFIELVQNGWIGARCLQASLLDDVIGYVVDQGHSLILGSLTPWPSAHQR